MKTPLVAALHTKTMAGDHGLNHDGDAIVIRLHRVTKTASGGIDLRRMLLQRAKGVDKMPGCTGWQALDSIENHRTESAENR
jgi:hypothetical protein